MRRSLFLIVAGLLLLPASYTFAGTSRPDVQPSSGVKVGSVAPDVSLKTLDGKTVSLSQYRGRVVMLNFWATWCPPCRAEMPSMERLNKAMNGLDFVMLAVNVEEDGAQVVTTFLQSNPHSFPVLLDSNAMAQNAYEVFRFPETFIINKDGVILNHILGAREWDETTTIDYLKFLAKG
jgi:thiol-disulfide isomerase/thioredoxin